jgi:hypothetical protein
MKLQLKFTIASLGLVILSSLSLHAQQSILGTWQLVKETTCIENELKPEKDESMENLVSDMKSRTAPSPRVVQFKEKLIGEESTRILNKKKSANGKNFLYKYTDETLLILDKKSQTITDSYSVDKISQDSLILSSASRPCETRIFLKIKEPK